MAEVVYDGVGTPVNDPNIVGAEVNTTPGNVIFTNSTNPREADFDGVGTPVADGNAANNPQNFDNKGINVTVSSTNSIFNNETSPTEDTIGTAGVPVGDGNSADNPVTFDNRSKNVTVAPAIGAPVGNDIERKLFTPPLNFNP